MINTNICPPLSDRRAKAFTGQLRLDVMLDKFNVIHQSHPSGPGRLRSAFNPISANVSTDAR